MKKTVRFQAIPMNGEIPYGYEQTFTVDSWEEVSRLLRQAILLWELVDRARRTDRDEVISMKVEMDVFDEDGNPLPMAAGEEPYFYMSIIEVPVWVIRSLTTMGF